MDYTISLTNRCNLKCSYCYERHLHTGYGCMTPQTMHGVTNFINRRGDAGTVFLFGGEPLLYKDQVRFFCAHLRAGQFVITTNGTLLDEAFIRWCMDRGVIIHMSHDGAQCAERGVDRAFLDNQLKLLLKYQPETLVQLVYTLGSLPQLCENILYLKGLGVRKISAAMDAFLTPDDPDRFGDLLREQWQRIAGIRNLFIHELAVKKKEIRNQRKSTCEMCRKKLFINWDGAFYPCVQFQNLPAYRCGDLSVGIEAERARKAHPDYAMTAARCAGCEIAAYCRNACACRKMATTGTVRDISEAACMEEQVLILTALELLSKEKGGH